MTRPKSRWPTIALGFLAALVAVRPSLAADWPQWRHDASRSNASPAALPAKLQRAWHLELPPPAPAWPDDQDKLAFDRAYEPIVVDHHLIVGSMAADHLASYDTRTGALEWRFFTEGPIRFAAAVADGRVYFVSDDGYLYCLELDGRLAWRVSGGPDHARGIGNQRLISLWPARGAPVIADGIVYFAASIWPFMGTFVHAVDARTGRLLWTNSGTGADYVMQQHNSQAFAGVAPQGYLAISGDRLIVPGGLTVPAIFSRDSGQLRYFDPSSRLAGRDAGGFAVATCRDWYFNRSEIYERAGGAIQGRAVADVLTGDGCLLSVQRTALQLRWLPPSGTLPVDSAGNVVKVATSKLPQLPFERQVTLHLPRRFDHVGCLAGNHAYLAADDGTLAAVELPTRESLGARESLSATVVWQQKILGRPVRLVAGDDRLFVSTREGWIYCLSAEGTEEPWPDAEQLPAVGPSGLATLVPRGADWSSLLVDAPPPAGWQQVDFDDSSWKTLPVAIDDEARAATTGGATDQAVAELTGYYRRPLVVAADAQFDEARLQISAPDRTQIWLDGQLVGRVDVRNGTVVTGGTANPRGPKWASQELDVKLELLTPGRHVVALQVPRLVAAQQGEAFQVELSAELLLNAPADVRLPAVPTNAPSFLADIWPRLAAAGAPGCWCVVAGDADGSLADAVLATTDWNLVVLAGRRDTAEPLRQRWLARNVLGRRVTVLDADWSDAALPPYLAHVVIDGRTEPLDATRLEAMFNTLRPYGGQAFVRQSTAADAAASQQRVDTLRDSGHLAGGQRQVVPQGLLLTRPHALPGAGDWTHQNGDAANTLMSPDTRVRLPLGILWFGGPSNAKILPRHGHGPVPQVVDGRLVIEGPDLLRAVDIYTGRLIWERRLKGLGIYYNNTAHHPGAGAIGGNYVTTPDGIYVAYGRQALRLDPATGRTLAEFRLPADGRERLAQNTQIPGETPAATTPTTGPTEPPPDDAAATTPNDPQGELAPYWGHLAVTNDLLIATSTPTPPLASSRFQPDQQQLTARFGEASRRLVVLDRYTGQVLWLRDARLEFRHNAIVAGTAVQRTRVFCLDSMTDLRKTLLARRGVRLDGENAILALDARTGQELWRVTVDTAYTWLGYSARHDVLLAAGSRLRDRATDEAGKGLTAFRGATGQLLWHSDASYSGPCLLHDDRIITQGEAYHLLTGRRLEQRHPLTQESLPWEWHRNYGCNSAVGCANLLTFRSAAAGFYDLESEGGTGNFGGFRSSCTNNLIPAGGLLNAPDYTRTCTCSYQNQTSLALVHRPDVEFWTFNPLKWSGAPIERLGLNFGAPGDRRADDDTMWLEFPSVGGQSPEVPVTVRPLQPAPAAGAATAAPTVSYFRHHASSVDDDQGWIAASGLTGAAEIEVTLAANAQAAPRNYTVRLVFAETEDVAAGQRSFDVRLQGRTVLEGFDIARAAGGTRRTVIQPFSGIQVRDKLIVTLVPRDGKLPPRLCGLELRQETPDSAPARRE